MLLCLPFLAALPGYFGGAGLTLVGQKPVMDLLGNQPFVSTVMDQNTAAWTGLYQDPPLASQSWAEGLLGHKAAVVFARSGDDPLAAGLKRLGLPEVMTAPSRPPAGPPVHLLDHIFASTGVVPCSETVSIRPTDEARAKASGLAGSLGLDGRDWVAVHPGSGSPRKNWPLSNWLNLAAFVKKKLGLPVIFIAGPAETDLARRLEEMDMPLLTGLDLPVLAAMLAMASIYAGNDSGVSHLAAGLGVPTLAVFGPTDPRCWAPRGLLVRTVGGEAGCWAEESQAIAAMAELVKIK